MSLRSSQGGAGGGGGGGGGGGVGAGGVGAGGATAPAHGTQVECCGKLPYSSCMKSCPHSGRVIMPDSQLGGAATSGNSKAISSELAASEQAATAPPSTMEVSAKAVS